MQKLPVWELIVHAYRFVQIEWRQMLRFILLPCAVILGCSFVVGFVAPLPGEVGQGAAAPMFWLVFLTTLVVVLVSGAMLTAALLRFVVLGQQPDDGYLSWINFDRSEKVVLILAVAFPLFWVLTIGGVIVLMSMAFGGHAGLGPAAPRPSAGPFPLLAFGLSAWGMLYVMFRLALVWPIASIRGEFGIRESWRLMRGNVLRLFLALLGVSILPLIVHIVIEVLAKMIAGQVLAQLLTLPISLYAFMLQITVLGSAYLIANGAQLASSDHAPVTGEA